MDQSLVLEASICASLSAASSKLSTTDQKLINMEKDDGAAVALLRHSIADKGMTVPMQDLPTR